MLGCCRCRRRGGSRYGVGVDILGEGEEEREEGVDIVKIDHLVGRQL